MAFKIRNKEEISLLSESQKIQYEHELDLYQKRADFVERLESLENVIIEPYEPDLKDIEVINVIQVKNFQKPEQTIQVLPLIKKPNMIEKSFDHYECENPDLPNVTIPDMDIRVIKQLETIQAELPFVRQPEISTDLLRGRFKKSMFRTPQNMPETRKADIEIRPFSLLMKIQPQLPHIVKPDMMTEPILQRIDKNQNNIPQNMPVIRKPGLEVKPFTPDVNTHPELPIVKIPSNVEKTFMKTHQTNMNLPIIAKPDIHVPLYKEVEFTEPQLPEVSGLSVHIKKVFKEPKLPGAVLPAVSKPNIEVAAFQDMECTVSVLPKVTVPIFPLKNFDNTGIQFSLQLPTVKKINKDFKPFRSIRESNPQLPAVFRVGIKTKTFEGIGKMDSDFSAPPSLDFHVKAFTMTAPVISGLPKPMKVQIPNINAVFPTVLPMIKAETKELEGADDEEQ